jgi:ATP-dependent helicase/nuclease subunit B
MLHTQTGQFPLLRALWAPRARRALAWAGEAIHEREAAGWTTMLAEAGGEMRLPNEITLRGRADRVDRNAAGELAIIDYKTGQPPTGAQVRAGFASQLGLLMAMAATGRLATQAGPVLPGTPLELAYWQLSGGATPGKLVDPLKGKPPLDAATHADDVVARAVTITDRLLNGPTPFEPKLYPGLAWGDYDHLARVAEWLDRPARRKDAA